MLFLLITALALVLELLFIVLPVISLIIIAYYVPIGLWLAALASNAHIPLYKLVLMRVRQVKPHILVHPLINATKAGIVLSRKEWKKQLIGKHSGAELERQIDIAIAEQLSIDKLEAHYLAGGNVKTVVDALISADKAAIDLDFKLATAIDLAGRDVFDAVQTSVNPKVLNTPNVSAVAKDGIQLIVQARVTVRANIQALIGGAGEDTILARVGEGIVSSIGSAEKHSKVLENPDLISKHVLAKQLDSGTAYNILSIDIADVDVGKNIGAALEIDRANANKIVAQANAEKRRADAIALEQENRAKAEQSRANVIQAEAEVPLAISEAFRKGNLGIMDYYQYKNIKADTDMRQSISASTVPFVQQQTEISEEDSYENDTNKE
ncbi:MAG: flotillin-like protein FloA [Chitinophagales bacterium]